MVEYLLTAGADVHGSDELGTTALGAAITTGDIGLALITENSAKSGYITLIPTVSNVKMDSIKGQTSSARVGICLHS